MNFIKDDIFVGMVGTATTFGLGMINALLGCIAGVLTVIILAFKLRREWKRRNEP